VLDAFSLQDLMLVYSCEGVAAAESAIAGGISRKVKW